MPKTTTKKNKVRSNAKKEAAKKLRARTSSNKVVDYPVDANVKRRPGEKLTTRQRMQLQDAGRDIHGNIEPMAYTEEYEQANNNLMQHLQDNLIPIKISDHGTMGVDVADFDPVVVDVEDAEVEEIHRMTQEQWEALKFSAQKKKRGFQKFCESQGWQLLPHGDKDVPVHWFKVIN